ncbi:MAG: flagellar basal body-associated FliL family protein [Alphaproteobacteria bacterium]|nr:flagellar basal body-associated FliL family protein [Alphaproteobacteria bacterium]
MAEENEEQQTENENESAATVAPKKKMLLLLIPVFLVVGTVIGLYFSGIADSFLPTNRSEDKKTEDTTKKKDADPSTVFFDVPEILVNLSVRPDQKPIYFKIRVALEMNSAADAEQADKMLPRIVDSMQFYLREMRLEEIQGSVGTYRLKEEIQGRLNRILAPVKVNDVLFKEILIQ